MHKWSFKSLGVFLNYINWTYQFLVCPQCEKCILDPNFEITNKEFYIISLTFLMTF